MGHVPPRPVSLDREGVDLPRRQHRRSRSARDPNLGNLRPGAIGERIASWYLSQFGLVILASNIEVGHGEIDLIVSYGHRPVAVEVRSLIGSDQPLDAVTDAKRDQVRTLAGRLGIVRCDAIGVGIKEDCVIIHWDPDSF